MRELFLKKEDVKNFGDIGDDMRQVFRNPFTKNVYKNEIIRMMNDRELSEKDLTVCELLFQYKFGTLEQLHKASKTDKSVSGFQNRLNRLIEFRIINEFALTYLREEQEEIPRDAFKAYCLDLGGQYLLTHFGKDENIMDWFYIENIVTSEIVAQRLLIFDFCMPFLINKPAGFKYLTPSPELRVGKRTLIPSFELCLEKNGRMTYFIGEVSRDQDVYTFFKGKMYKWNELLTTHTWKKYYNANDDGNEPVVLLMTNGIEAALQASRIFSEIGEISKFRVTTQELLENPLYESGTFMRYDPERRGLVNTAIKNFKPEE